MKYQEIKIKENMRMYLFGFDLDLNRMYLILKFDLDNVKMYLYTKNEFPGYTGSNFIV